MAGRRASGRADSTRGPSAQPRKSKAGHDPKQGKTATVSASYRATRSAVTKKPALQGRKGSAAPQAKPATILAPKSAQTPSVSRGKGTAGKAQQQRRRLSVYRDEDGEAFRPGDSAYVVMDPDRFDEANEGREPCEGCGEVALEDEFGVEVPMLECSSCLRGFHLSCLAPPLAEVPEDDWLCDNCIAGEEPRPREHPITAREHVQAGTLALARIDAIWRDGSGTAWFTARWYVRPEETHAGRQKHHVAREVFLTQQTDDNEVASLLRRAQVYGPADFTAAEHAGDDVFLYEHEYDTIWKRFRRRSEAEDDEKAAGSTHRVVPASDDDASDGDFEGEDEDAIMSDDECDHTFRPVHSVSRGRGAGLKARGRHQGGDEWRAGKMGTDQVQRGAARQLTPMGRARAALALTATPKSLPCREKERAELTRFVEATVTPTEREGEARGRCVYVAGVPGTGKTALVLEVMQAAKQRVREGELPTFQFVEINALRLPSPHHAYVTLYEAMTGERVGTKAALLALEALFRSNAAAAAGSRQTAKPMTVVLVDEMDLLVTRNQSVLYNLFEWPTLPGARMAVIGVANTFDMPERVLPKIASRLGSARIPFQPYTKAQLVTIISQRLADADALACFESNSLDFAARKVAGVTGDLRRALELCRKAAEIAEREGVPSVRLQHIDLAVRAMFGATHMQLLRTTCLLDKLLLAGLLLETRFSGRVDAVLGNVARRIEDLSTGRVDTAICSGDVVASAVRLGSQRLLLADCGSCRLRMRVSLNVPQADVVHVLTDEATGMPWMRSLNL